MALDINDLNPEFARRMALFLRDAKAQGITGVSLNSGYRSNEEQARIRAEHEAMPGGVYAHPAAPAGGSYHNYGFATDIVGPDLPKLRAFAAAHPEYGIFNNVPRDPNHFQFNAKLAELKASPPALESGVDIDEVRKYLANFGAGQETTPGLAPPPPSAYGVTSTPPAPTGSALGPNLGTTITTTPNTGTTPTTTVATPPAAPVEQPSVASLIGKGDWKGALAAGADNSLISGGINKISSGMGQQHASPSPQQVPQLQDNSAAIASQAPQMMAALLAQVRARQQGPQQQQQIPGLSLMNKRQY
jgi:hypothetical protein